MSNDFIVSSRVQRNVTHYQRVAHFKQIANPEDGAIGSGPAKKIDSEAGRNRKRNDAKPAENGDVESDIGH